MNLLTELTALKEKLENESSTKRCIFEQLIIVERMIRIVKKANKDFFCGCCVCFERDKDDPAFGICRYTNDFYMVNEKDWCLRGLKASADEGISG